jgi:hypothetical protein
MEEIRRNNMNESTLKTMEDAKDLIRGLTLMGTGGGRPDMGMDYLLPHIRKKNHCVYRLRSYPMKHGRVLFLA